MLSRFLFLIAAAGLILLVPHFDTGAHAADWSGSWDTKWPDGGARLELQQSGDHVSGRYPLYDGEITAEAKGQELKGNWKSGPNSGTFLFTLGPEGRSFVGRFDDGKWWTGDRTTGAVRRLPVEQSSVRSTLRTFVEAGNLAKAGLSEQLGTQAAVLDFGKRPQPVLLDDKYRLARDLFRLVNLTTFQIWALPDKRLQAESFAVDLRQAGTEAVLHLDFVRRDGKWFIVVPPDDQLAAARKALLVRYGGRSPEPSAYTKLHSARDTMTAFQSAFADWTKGGQNRVVDTLDTSQLFPATRAYEAGLDAQYLKQVLDRVIQTLPQEIPDDPASRQPYQVFAHPVGNIVIAPSGDGDKVVWRFTPDTLKTIRSLYTAVEAMPLADPGLLGPPSSAFFAERSWLRGWAPALMAPAGPVEEWQILFSLVALLLLFAVAILLSRVLMAVLSRAGVERTGAADLALRWPLPIALTAILYKLFIPLFGWPEEVRRFSAPIHAVIIAVFGLWASWYLIEIATDALMRRARETPSRVDDIAISLGSGAVRLGVLFLAASYVAAQLDLPTNGIIAGLGISGLAVAFASKETLSNVFGAGILVADRPFTKGDVIKAGDIQGTVEHVGIRSTRVRGGDGTETIVPNGKLSDASIQNRGVPTTYKQFQTNVRVAYGATMRDIDDFLAKMRTLLADDPDVAPDGTAIGIVDLGETAVVIAIKAHVRDEADEGAVKSRLMLGILRLAEQDHLSIGGTPAVLAQAAASAAPN